MARMQTIILKQSHLMYTQNGRTIINFIEKASPLNNKLKNGHVMIQSFSDEV